MGHWERVREVCEFRCARFDRLPIEIRRWINTCRWGVSDDMMDRCWIQLHNKVPLDTIMKMLREWDAKQAQAFYARGYYPAPSWDPSKPSPQVIDATFLSAVVKSGNRRVTRGDKKPFKPRDFGSP